MKPPVLAGLALGAAIPAYGLDRRYRRVRGFSGRRFIAASRFGYLGSSMPPDATPAHQADAFVSNAAVEHYNLKGISVPTLIIHTKDDQVASHDASQRATQRIPGARFVSLESGGHLMIGQTTIVRDELARFLAEMPNRGAARVASSARTDRRISCFPHSSCFSRSWCCIGFRFGDG